MNNLTLALNKIQDAESQIHELVAIAMRDGQFNEARDLIDMAAALANLRGQFSQVTSDSTFRPPGAVESTNIYKDSPKNVVTATTPIASHLGSKTSSAVAYPQFERDGDRLVKIGWSTKEKRPYEHRVERKAVSTILAAFAEKFRSKRPIKVEKFLPVRDSDGSEIPSYQAYLVLKWLQHFHAIDRRGKDGYVLRVESLNSAVMGDLWERTSERGQ